MREMCVTVMWCTIVYIIFRLKLVESESWILNKKEPLKKHIKLNFYFKSKYFFFFKLYSNKNNIIKL